MNSSVTLRTPFVIQKFESIEDFIMTIFPDIESYMKKALSSSDIHRSDSSDQQTHRDPRVPGRGSERRQSTACASLLRHGDDVGATWRGAGRHISGNSGHSDR